MSTLHDACYECNLSEVKRLVEIRVNVNEKNKSGLTPLFVVIQLPIYRKHRKDIYEYLIQQGANVNVSDQYGFTPLMQSIFGRDVELVDYLLQHGAIPNAVNGSGSMALEYLFDSKDSSYTTFEIFKLLINNNAIVPNKMLTEIFEYDDIEIIKFLIDNHEKLNINLNYLDSHNWSPLITSIYQANSKAVYYLLKNGADPNIHYTKDIPLHVACKFRREEIVKLLIDYGANRNYLDRDDRLPISYLSSIDKSILEMLRS